MGCVATSDTVPPKTQQENGSDVVKGPDARKKDPFKIHEKKKSVEDAKKKRLELVQEVKPNMPKIFEETKASEESPEEEKKK